MRHSGSNRVRDSAIAGAVAWLVGVTVAAVVLVLFSSAVVHPLALVNTATVFYYTFHLWPVVLVPGGLSASAVVFAPVAMVVLFWTGFRHAIRADVSTGKAGFSRGASVVVGYGGLALVSLVAFEIRLETALLADPGVTAVMVGTTGFVFPVVFAGLGGWVAGR